jgi:hypothetical protein
LTAERAAVRRTLRTVGAKVIGTVGAIAVLIVGGVVMSVVPRIPGVTESGSVLDFLGHDKARPAECKAVDAQKHVTADALAQSNNEYASNPQGDAFATAARGYLVEMGTLHQMWLLHPTCFSDKETANMHEFERLVSEAEQAHPAA